MFWLSTIFFTILIVDMILIRHRNKHLKEAAKWAAMTNSIVNEWIKEHKNTNNKR